MSLLQQIDLKAVDAGQKSVDNHSRSKQAVGSASEEDRPFKEQLNKQIDQVKSKSESKNTDNNQQDKSISVDDVEKSDGVAVVPEAEVEAVVSEEFVESVADNSLQTVEVSELLNVEGFAPVIASSLPETGSALPPSNALAQTPNFVKGQVAAVQAPVVNVAKSQQLTSSIDSHVQHINELINKASVSPVKSAAETLETTKPLNIPVNLTAALSEKANIQDARYTKVVSEMPTTDVITQTTRLQQVPLSTAVSSSVLAAQNTSVASITETLNTGLSGALNTATSSSTLNSSIAVSIQNPNWSQQMTQQVSYMIKGGFQQAEIKLNPANLGPIEIKLALNDDQASVNFVAQHAPVRDALDAALPRLKEMLEQQGLNLADVNVSTQSEQHQSAESQQDGNAESQADLLSENSALDDSEQELIVNMDVNSGVSIFA